MKKNETEFLDEHPKHYMTKDAGKPKPLYKRAFWKSIAWVKNFTAETILAIKAIIKMVG